MNTTWISLGALAMLAPAIHRRIQLSRAKHRSLAGHSRMAKRLARWLPGYSYTEQEFFGCDGAPEDIQNRRRQAFHAMAKTLQSRHRLSIEATQAARSDISDMQFIAAYRVPFQFSPIVREHLKVGSFLQSAQGVQVTDLDGQTFYDLTGSYGVNVFGADFYKKTMAEGLAKTQALGPVLGSYHPCVASNATRLKALSGMDEVSFHMSGTEAVMQAVRLARYHTRRKNIVRFCGAYHGWWEDVQPGPGNPMPPRETYTLSDMNERSLDVLRTRTDIA
ncbi:MAG: Glutamate-semialdehyde -aminomutase, partial [Pseudomonadota bacterium]